MFLLFRFEPHQLEIEVARVWSPLPVVIIIIIIIIIINIITIIIFNVIIIIMVLPIEYFHLFCSQAQRSVSLWWKIYLLRTFKYILRVRIELS